MFKNLFSKPIEAAKTRVSEYVDLKLEALKLSTIEKASPIAASIVIGSVMLTLLLITFVFIGMGLAQLFSNLVHSEMWGYFICAGVFLLFLILLAICFRPIVRGIARWVGKALSNNL